MAAAILCLWAQNAGAAGTFYVNGANTSCSDTGPGTSASPYCTILAAVTQQAGPGTTINVKSAVYREQITVPISGSSSSPFVIHASGSSAVIEGADDYGSSSKWTLVSGNVYQATSVTWQPLQVFADGVRLAPSTAAPASLPAKSFTYVGGSGLYVNVGGGNPGSHKCQVGHRAFGFFLNGRSYVTIDGFVVQHHETKGIYVSNNSNNTTIKNNTVKWANTYGVQVDSCSNVMIDGNTVSDNNNHGIALTAGSMGCTVQDNESFQNARPDARAANGLYLNNSSNNRIQRNLWHDNQDTGQHIQSGSINNLSIQNRSWKNGDHGYDHLNSSGTTHIGDVAWGNTKDGFSIEGNSTGTRVFNCIATDNGLNTDEFDLWVDATSGTGLVSDYNIFWNSTAQPPIRNGSTKYAAISSFTAATGQDAHSIQADPIFIAPSGGDFHLGWSSPAIDAASSSVTQWPSSDAEGRSRTDDLAVPNSGAGSVVYADRGALEYKPSGQSPIAFLKLTPTSGRAPLAVTADGSGSSDPDGTVSLYKFDFGDGTVIGPQSGATADHTYGTGTWTAKLTVIDNAGRTATASVKDTVTSQSDRPPTVTAPGSASGPENGVITVDVTASDPDGDSIASLAADLSGLPAEGSASFTQNASHTSGTLTWTPSYSDAGSYVIKFTAANVLSGMSNTTVTVTNVDRAPQVVAPAISHARPAAAFTLTVTASDPDGDAIASLTANLGVLPGGSATFTPGPANTSGTLSWTPGPADAGPYQVGFTASNAMAGTAWTSIVVSADQPPVVTAPAYVGGTAGNPLTASVTVSDPDGDPITSLTADLSSLPAGNNATFTVGAGNASATLSWTPTASDTGTFSVTFTATNGLSGSATTSMVVGAGQQNLIGNPSFEVGLTGWSPYGSAALARVAGGHDGSWALEMTGPGSVSQFGVNDTPNWVQSTGSAGTRYRVGAWIRSSANVGRSRVRVREYVNSTQVGSTTYSPSLTLSPTWQLLSVDYVTAQAGSALDIQIVDDPVAAGEKFQTDDISIRVVTTALVAATVITDVTDASALSQPAAPTAERGGLAGGRLQAEVTPSPMRSQGRLRFVTSRAGKVTVGLFDCAGRRVRTLMEGAVTPEGVHAIELDGQDQSRKTLTPGIYFYSIQAPEGTKVGRFVILE